MISLRKISIAFIPIAFLTLLAHPAAFSDYAGVKFTLLKKTTTTTNGRKIFYPQTDSPEVTAAIVEIPPGVQTGWHQHTVPVYGYVLAGELIIEFKDGKQNAFKEGDAIIEVVNTPHNGRNSGNAPAKLVVFYTGVEGKGNTVELQNK